MNLTRKATKTRALYVRLDPDVAAAVQAEATTERRSISSVINKRLADSFQPFPKEPESEE